MMNKNKVFAFAVLSLFALVAVSGFASATQCLNLVTTPPATVNHDQSSFSVPFTLSLDSGCDTGRTGVTWAFSSNIAGMTWATPQVNSLAVGQTSSSNLIFSLPSGKSGMISITVTVDSAQDDPETFTISNIAINEERELTITKTKDLTQTQNGTIKVKNNGNIQLNNIDLSSSGDFTVDFSEENFNLAPGAEKSVIISSADLGTVGFGGKTAKITAVALDGTTSNLNISISGSFCKNGEVGGNLEITDINIDNSGEGDDNTWDLLDTLEVEVSVENTGDDDINDVIVELGLYDGTGKNKVGDLNFDNADEEQIELGDLNDGDDDTVTFTFKVPADFDDGDYKLTVKTYSDDSGESDECTATSGDFETGSIYTSIDVQRETDEGKFIAFDNFEFTPTEGTCGDKITMMFDVYNIGDDDQDQVQIILKNTELGIDESLELRSDLNQGDKESVSFDFVVPQNAKDKTYTLALSAEYDYSRGSYRESSDTDTTTTFKVLGCSTTPQTGNVAAISAVLESDQAMAGENLVVRATVTNLKSSRASFAVDGDGYQSWATLDNVSPRIVDLEAGASQDVLFTFTIDEDATGEQSFSVEVKDSAGKIETREIGVNVEGASTPGFGGFNLGNNSFLWVVGIINVVLVILIIIVAVRVARR
jgi:uncharacterized membrane protein